jgi:transcriptional regulator of acetoin/glycerol metabolism
VSAIEPKRSERAHGLTCALTTAAAGAIEERYFREHFRRQWVIAVAMEESASTVLLSVDGNQPLSKQTTPHDDILL